MTALAFPQKFFTTETKRHRGSASIESVSSLCLGVLVVHRFFRLVVGGALCPDLAQGKPALHIYQHKPTDHQPGGRLAKPPPSR